MSDLMLKCIKFDFRRSSAPVPARRALPDTLAVFKGATSKGKEGNGTGGKANGEGNGRRGYERGRGGLPKHNNTKTQVGLENSHIVVGRFSGKSVKLVPSDVRLKCTKFDFRWPTPITIP